MNRPTSVKPKYLRGLVPPRPPTLKLAHQVAELHGAARYLGAHRLVHKQPVRTKPKRNPQLDRQRTTMRHRKSKHLAHQRTAAKLRTLKPLTTTGWRQK